jgi:hypothetical protein
MRKIMPYKTQRNALAALDNGGRFYNIFTEADDGEISTAELARVAGAFTDKQKMFLYLDMALAGLDQDAAHIVINSMSNELKQAYGQFKPAHYIPSEANIRGKASKSAIVTGIPHYVKSNSDFTGFIMIPISTGKTTTFMMVPMIDHYDVYEVRDKDSSEEFLVAHARGTTKLKKKPTAFGGILKKLQNEKGENAKQRLFLEALYYYHICA